MCLINPSRVAAAKGCHCNNCERKRTYGRLYARRWLAIPENREKKVFRDRLRLCDPLARERKRASARQQYQTRADVRERQRINHKTWYARNRELVCARVGLYARVHRAALKREVFGHYSPNTQACDSGKGTYGKAKHLTIIAV